MKSKKFDAIKTLKKLQREVRVLSTRVVPDKRAKLLNRAFEREKQQRKNEHDVCLH